MRLGEILDGSFNIYRRHFGLFMRLSLILVWLPAAATIYFNLRFSRNPIELMAAFQENMGRFIGYGLLGLVVWVVCSLLLTAGTIRIISDSYLGQEPELGASLRLGMEKIGSLIVVALSKGLLLVIVEIVGTLAAVLLFFIGKIGGTGIGVLLAVIGGCGAVWFLIWVWCGYGVTTPIVVLEGLSSSFDAFGRSWELTRGARGKLFGTVAVAYLISQFVPQIIVQAMSGAFGVAGNTSLQPFFVVVAWLLSIVLAPILPCAYTLLYYDLRVRREAFDLQVLSAQLGTGSEISGSTGTR